MNKLGLLFGDVWAENSAPVDLDRRADDSRVINSITQREQIVFDLASGRKTFVFLHLGAWNAPLTTIMELLMPDIIQQIPRNLRRDFTHYLSEWQQWILNYEKSRKAKQRKEN